MSPKVIEDGNTLYQTIASSAFQAESVRWARLNNFLMLESILAVAWWAALANDDLRSQPWLLTLVCAFGILFGIQWVGLGYRSSKFVNMFHSLAEKMDAERGPFKSTRGLRKNHWGVFKSTIILTEVPALFVLLFSALIWVSWDVQSASSIVIVKEGVNNMVLAVQWAQLIGTGALVLTLIAVIWYTVKTSAMANATKTMAEAEGRNTELRKRPIVRFVVADKVVEKVETTDTGQLHITKKDPFCFRTYIHNSGTVHAKVKVTATVIHNKRPLKFPEGSLYEGKRIMEMQAGTGVDGHLSFENLFKENGITVKTEEDAGTELTKYEDRELMVRLESKVIYYYKLDSDFDTASSQNPPAYYRWKGNFAIDAYGSWIPEYDVDDFDSFP